MNNIYFNRKTLKGSNFMTSPMDIIMEVGKENNLTKIIPKYDKDIQKIDENKNLIYLKNIYKTIQKEKVIGTEITTEVTETPYIKNIWKTNEKGFKLYSQNIYNEQGESTGETEETTNYINVLSWKEEIYYEATKKVVGRDEEGNFIYDYEKVPYTHNVVDEYEYNEPIYIDFHMEDEEGNKLYIKDIKETWEEKEIVRIEETTEPIQVFSYKKEEATKFIREFISCDHICDELCSEIQQDAARCQHEHSELCNPVYEEKEVVEFIDVPDEFEENKPCMIPSYKNVTVDILSNPEEFEITELLMHTYEQQLADSNYDYILADVFINENDIDFSYDKHSANTGAFVCCLHPQGKVRLKQLDLEKPAKVFEMLTSEIPDGIDVFINNVKFVGKKLILPKETQKCTIRFENTTDKYLDIKSYCIAY